MKNGIDMDVAFALDSHEAWAWGVIFGEFEGGRYDWGNYSWIER